MDYENTLLEDLEEMCRICARELHVALEKVRNSGGRLSAGDVEYVDKLTHALKSIKTSLAMMEAGYSGDGSGDGMSGARRRSRRTGRYYSGEGSGDGSGDGMSNRSYHQGGQQMAQQLRKMADMMEQQ